MTKATRTEPRIVTPREAEGHDEGYARHGMIFAANLAHTVATEPDRTRAAVVKALRDFARLNGSRDAAHTADEIENGAAF
jgi:hypothetical protein